MQTETVTFLKENANNLNLDEALLVTKNGKPRFVVQSYQDYQDLQDSVALLKLLTLSEKSGREGELLSVESKLFRMTKAKVYKGRVYKGRVYKVKATPYFKLSVQRLSAFLSRKYSPQHAVNSKKSLLKEINRLLPEQPSIAVISARLLALGISDFRQWPVDEHNIVFCRVNDKNAEVTLLLIMDARQDIQKLLYELVLLE